MRESNKKFIENNNIRRKKVKIFAFILYIGMYVCIILYIDMYVCMYNFYLNKLFNLFILLKILS